LGLPFITFQLKHFYDALGGKLNNITLLYGNLASKAAETAVHEPTKSSLSSFITLMLPLPAAVPNFIKPEERLTFREWQFRG
jgi:hypothetical protein